jgi:RNA polymerase-binding transcription factor DksA
LRSIPARGLGRSAPENRVAYIDSATLERDGIHLPYTEIMAHAEQLVYRSTACVDSADAGVCEHCGCTIPKAAMVASKT